MQIKDVPNSERPFEKASKYGVETLSNQEILSLIIRVGVKENSVLDIAMQILQLIYDKQISLDNLLQIKGVSKIKAIKILAVTEFARRYSSLGNKPQLIFNNANDVYLHFKERLQDEKQERFIVLYLDNKGALIQEKTLFKGSVNASLIDTKLVFSNALELGSNKIICVHNHPSGNIIPSQGDKLATDKLKMTADIMDITFLDHIIIGNGYYSFREHMKK